MFFLPVMRSSMSSSAMWRIDIDTERNRQESKCDEDLKYSFFVYFPTPNPCRVLR